MNAPSHTDPTFDIAYQANESEPDDSMSLGEMWTALRTRWVLLTVGPLAAGALALGITGLIAPTFTAVTTFMPPQQAQGGMTAALGSLAGLASLTGAGGSLSSLGDRYIALMQSVTVSDRLIDQFKLLDLYDKKFRSDARKELSQNARFSLGKKDGLISVEFDDHDPQRASDIANRYLIELRSITGSLAVTEAQQRRVFFEQQLQQSRDRLVQAQQALQASGFNPGALKSEPKAAAEAYVRLKSETTAAEVRLQTLRGMRADGAPEVMKQQTELDALRRQLGNAERASDNPGGPDYVSKYREFKYQETLFELYARQFELARLDESREGALIQVVDTATAPERKSKPKRTLISGGAVLGTALALMAFVLMRQSMRRQVDLGRPSMT